MSCVDQLLVLRANRQLTRNDSFGPEIKKKCQGKKFNNVASHCIVIVLCFKLEVLLSRYIQKMSEHGFISNLTFK